MPRAITDAAKTAISADMVRLSLLVSLEFSNDYTLYLWSGFGDMTWNGNTYLGNGWLRPVSGLDESTELKATGCEIVLTGVGSDIMALVLNYANQRLKGRVYFAPLNADGTLVADPIPLFVGKLDVPEIVDSADESVVRLKYESDLIKLSRTNEWRYTDAAQRALYPDDLGFQYMYALDDWKGFWGQAKKKKKKKESQKPRKNKH